MVVRLKNSKEVLVTNGKIHRRILEDLIVEAWLVKDLYAEESIIYSRKDKIEGRNIVEEASLKYKELWDCYHNVFGKDFFDPAYKNIPMSLKRAVLVGSYANGLLIKFDPDFLGEENDDRQNIRKI